VLKLKFQKLHTTVVDSVNAADAIGFLFQEGVLGAEDMRTLLMLGDPRKQCRDLLALLHTSENPQAFVKLYLFSGLTSRILTCTVLKGHWRWLF